MRRSLGAVLTATFSVTLLASSSFVTVAGTVTHTPRITVTRDRGAPTSALGWASSNWSGYAITGSFNSVTGSWTVPTVQPSRKATYSASWVGMDGFNNSNLIQSGTEQEFYSGSAHYYAWWEILPAAETPISSLTISPGDKMSVDIHQVSGSTWSITIADNTTGRSFSTSQTYTGPGTSAEWIEEAPTVGGRTAPLANYGTATFDPGTANGKNPGIVANDGGSMIQRGSQVSTPSNPDGDTDGFAAAYGPVAPPPPAS